MQAQAEETLWETFDTAVAAYLEFNGYAVETFRWEDGRRCHFGFRQTERLDELLEDLNRGEACVDPIRYNRAFGALKRRMFDSPNAPSR